MTRRLTILMIALFVGLAATPASAGWDEGAAAYGRGDYETALREWRPLAERGNAKAQYYLGLMYAEGQGVPQNYGEAAKWWRKAAELGYVGAQYNLGIMYDNGRGVAQDYAEAMKWYRKAAELGDAQAQHNVGSMYDKGQGVAQDNVQAYMWLNLAAAQRDETARENRDIVAKRMTPEQIAEAQRLAREWKPKQ